MIYWARILRRIGYLCLLICFMGACMDLLGCKPRKHETPPADFKSVQEPLPPPAPIPSVAPIKQRIKAADTKTDEAIALTKNVPQAAPLQPILSAVKTEHAAAQVESDNTQQQVETYVEREHKTDEVQAKNLKAVQGEADETIAAKQTVIDDQEKTIAKLENEELNAAKHRLMLIGVLLLLAGVGSAVAMFTIGFPAGLKVAAICAPMGSVCIVLAINLSKIVFWTEWGLIGGAVLALIYLAWHFFHRDPADPIHKIVAVPKITEKGIE